MFNKITLTPRKITMHHSSGQDYHLNAAETAAFLRRDDSVPSILPVAVRWMSPDASCWLVERPPTRVSVFYHATDKTTAARSGGAPRQLSIPWQLYLVNLAAASLRVMFAREPISDVDSEVCYAPLPNTNANGVCTAESLFSGDRHRPAAQRLNQAITQFWTTGFNDNMRFTSVHNHHHTSGGVFRSTKILPRQLGEVRSVSGLVDAYEAASVPEVLAWDWVRYGSVADLITSRHVESGTSAWQAFCARLWSQYKTIPDTGTAGAGAR